MKARITPGKGTKVEVVTDGKGTVVAVELVPTFTRSTGQATLAEVVNTNDHGVALDSLDLVVSAKTGRMAKVSGKEGGVKAAADAITVDMMKTQAAPASSLGTPATSKPATQASGTVPPRPARVGGQDRQ